ncbi:hypothetical protein PLICRDRAFT_101656 [Plicaturopsis crispa FD-325 SS-3]|nr:hypothetical protein PLICRDRAFT_101656 [Plicaturopsis crispa FD-325 SS-3]
MPRRVSSWRIVSLAIIIVSLAIGVFRFQLQGSVSDVLRKQQGHGLSSFPATYTRSNVGHRRVSFSPGSFDRPANPDTTAVVLNWSRLPNVVRIAAVLCDPLLTNPIGEVFIWNNSPRQLSFKDFEGASCPPEKLRIHNSPDNLYFQARFLACAQASMPNCFVQDDDYLVLPEIIRAMQFRFNELQLTPENNAPTLHVLPPHEHLTSQLRTLESPSQKIHASFAWLGHGAMLTRRHAAEFLRLMGPSHLNASHNETLMADNYFTILSNRIPEIWFDHGIELGGGQAFTVGTEGEERNRHHIGRAGHYLDLILSRYKPSWLSSLLLSKAEGVPFTTVIEWPSISSYARAPCLGSVCLLETTINLLPAKYLDLLSSTEAAEGMLTVEEGRRRVLGGEAISHYLDYPLSQALDGQPGTAFRSSGSAQAGDMVTMDLMSTANSSGALEMAWLVDKDTESILRASEFQISADKISWLALPHELSCADAAVDGAYHLRECSIAVSSATIPAVRYIRTSLQEMRQEQWCIYEVWTRRREE